MKYDLIAEKYKVSKAGIGGHYSKMEEGDYEHRYAQVLESEIALRRDMIAYAFDNGINYFDTTWRNESDMLGRSISDLGIRDKIFVNGMVLGSFSGSEHMGITPEEYVDKWLNERLKNFPEQRFNSFMINAIEEKYDEAKCESLIRHLEKRKSNGDFDVLGFSCHDHRLARTIADKFPQFEIIMLAYNYKNRSFEEHFNNYSGNASFVAMKPLIWYEYGIPFCKINQHPTAKNILGIEPDFDITTKAIKWDLQNPLIKTTVCAVNNMDETKGLIMAGECSMSAEDEKTLKTYRNAIDTNRIAFLSAALLSDSSNRRSLSFAINSLAHAINYKPFNIPLNESNTDERLLSAKEELLQHLKTEKLL